MKVNYDGYKFNGDIEEKVFNPNLVMYFIKEYLENNKVSHNLLDRNIVKLFNNDLYQDVIKNILENKYIMGFFQENFILSENLFNKKESEAKNQLISYSKDNRLNNAKKYIIIYSGKDLKKVAEIK